MEWFWYPIDLVAKIWLASIWVSLFLQLHKMKREGRLQWVAHLAQ